jgi:hypothetical protein
MESMFNIMDYIKIFVTPVCILFLITLFGCQFDITESENNNSEVTEYSGHWYIPERGQYLSILDDDDIRFYYCSIYDEYKIDSKESAVIDTGLFKYSRYNEEIYKITDVGLNKYLISESDEDYKLLFVQVLEIPSSCIGGNGVEVSSFSPKNAIEGNETQFTVSFDYRSYFDDEDRATITVGHSNNRGDKSWTVVNNVKLEIDRTELTHDSFTFTATPIILDNGEPFKLFISFEVPYTEDPSQFTLAGQDSVIVEVESNN